VYNNNCKINKSREDKTMTKKEKEFYRNKKAIAVKCTSNFGGISILEVNYSINDTVVFKGEADDIHEVRIYSNVTDSEPYFMYRGRREFLSDYMRV
jgi:hypothetical protein